MSDSRLLQDATTAGVQISDWGRQRRLIARVPFAAGEAVVCETPLVSAPRQIGQETSNPWDLVERLLSAPALLERYYSHAPQVTRFFMFPSDRQIERALAKRFGRQRQMVCALYYSLGTNNIAYFDAQGEIAGWAYFPVLSRANHSCEPNADIRGGDPEKQEVRLVARRAIAPGDPVTWNYSGNDAFLGADYSARNFALWNVMRFVCRCERCQREIPAGLSGSQNLESHFDRLVRQEAARLAGAP